MGEMERNRGHRYTQKVVKNLKWSVLRLQSPSCETQRMKWCSKERHTEKDNCRKG